MSTQSLNQNISRGARWVFYWRMTNRLVGLANTLVLIRILLPADFGLIALATSVSTAVEQLAWLGVEQSLVREKELSPALYNTGFTLNVLRSCITGSCVALAAYPAALFFAEPRLTEILLCLAAATAFMGCENIGIIDFQRNFAFEKEFAYLAFARVTSLVISVSAALILRSYWALVIGIVVSRLLRVVSSYLFHPFRPRFTLSAWRRLIGYSTWTWIWGMANILRERTDTIAIGWKLTTLQVGIFSVAFDFAALVTSEILEPLQRATFAGFVRARDTGVPEGQPLTDAIGMALVLLMPAAVGLAIIADPFTRLVIGLKWLDAVPLLQILCLGGMSTVPGVMCRVLLNSRGHLRVIVGLTIVFGLVRITLLMLLISTVGLTGAALAAAISMAAESAAYVLITRMRGDVGLRHLTALSWRPLAAAGAMAGLMYATGLGWRASTATGVLGLMSELVVEVAAGAAIYVSVLLSLWLLSGRPAGPERALLTLARSRLMPVSRELSGTVAGRR